MKNSKTEFDIDSNESASATLPTSRSTLGTTTVSSNGVSKHDTILEDK